MMHGFSMAIILPSFSAHCHPIFSLITNSHSSLSIIHHHSPLSINNNHRMTILSLLAAPSCTAHSPADPKTTSSPAKGRHLHGRPAQEFGPVRSAHVGRCQRGAHREGQAKWEGHDLPKLCLRLEPYFFFRMLRHAVFERLCCVGENCHLLFPTLWPKMEDGVTLQVQHTAENGHG